MKKAVLTRLFSVSLCVMLIAAMAFFTSGCSNDSAKSTSKATVSETATAESGVIGTGNTIFYLTVEDGTGASTDYEVHTDETTVGDALSELGMLEGEEGEFGLYIKKVNGIEADYDKDGTYWAFYIDGEYATTGIDVTDITPGSSYSLKVEK